ncbi:HNH endonuclease [Oceanospirillaceae bacterium]|nr:HNH endonuclease [Oceanospirillaceae bacterium]
MLKKGIVVAILLIGLITASTNLWAHGGRLNSQGCHNQTKDGTYHCHRSSSKSRVNNSVSAIYNRENWKFRSSASPISSSVLGWYTGIDGSATDVDHVVALKDAYLSGGLNWNSSQKQTFANDPLNHVASVPYVNRTLKNAYVPLKFITKLSNSRYTFANGKCVEYVDLYVQVKQKYGLSFARNNISAAKVACR